MRLILQDTLIEIEAEQWPSRPSQVRVTAKLVAVPDIGEENGVNERSIRRAIAELFGAEDGRKRPPDPLGEALDSVRDR